MNIIKLTNEHIEGVRPLFYDPAAYVDNPMFLEQEHFSINQQDKLYTTFCDAYLSDLNNFCAFGAIDENGVIHALISFFISDDEPSWYLTNGRSRGHTFVFQHILDKIIKYNESNGRLMFYTILNSKQAHLMQSMGLTHWTLERYDYFDQYKVNASERPFYQSHWEILFKRTLIPVDTTIRCTFLKQKYRISLPIGGNI